ncbi:hypothetical protein FOZ62_001736, partial [Perkinsus olseni]
VEEKNPPQSSSPACAPYHASSFAWQAMRQEFPGAFFLEVSPLLPLSCRAILYILPAIGLNDPPASPSIPGAPTHRTRRTVTLEDLADLGRVGTSLSDSVVDF